MNLIVGCAVLFGVPGHETGGPERGIPLYKNAPNQDYESLSRQWSRLEKVGSEPHSAALDGSERPYVMALLQSYNQGDNQIHPLIKQQNINLQGCRISIAVGARSRVSLDSEKDREQSNLCWRVVTYWQPPGSGCSQ